jgi:hypothetical protein
VRGFERFRSAWSGAERLAFVGLNAMTSLLVLGANMALMDGRDPTIFMTRDAWAAISYVRDHAEERAVVLAPPVTSLFVIASAPLRVVAGHPAETPRAEATFRAVEDFYREGAALPPELLQRVDYILTGRPAAGVRGPRLPQGFEEIFHSGRVGVHARPAPTPR